MDKVKSSLFDLSGRSCYEFRIGVEGEAAAAAARNRSTKDLRRLAGLIAHLHDDTQAGEGGIVSDFKFHLAVAVASKNHFYPSVLTSLRPQIVMGMELVRGGADYRLDVKLTTIDEQHVLIYEAIANRDVERARHLMRDHLEKCKASTSQWDDVFVLS